MDEENIVGGGFEVAKLEANGFVDAAADAVAADGGFENFFADNYSKAGFSAGIAGVDK